MTLSIIFIFSMVSVFATLITLSRVVGWRWILRNATLVDVAFTVMLMIVLAGTLTGMLIAILAGLVMAGSLSAARYIHKQADKVRAHTAKCITPCDPDEPVEGWDGKRVQTFKNVRAGT